MQHEGVMYCPLRDATTPCPALTLNHVCDTVLTHCRTEPPRREDPSAEGPGASTPDPPSEVPPYAPAQRKRSKALPTKGLDKENKRPLSAHPAHPTEQAAKEAPSGNVREGMQGGNSNILLAL